MVSALKLKWTDNGGEWMSETVTNEIAPARIKVSSKNSDGTYSYFCYRNAKAIAVTRSLEEAKAACERGHDPKTDNVLDYVKNNPGELPPFLMLTEAERKAVRAGYPYAAPAPRTIAAAEKKQALVMPPAPRAARFPPNETPMMPMPPEDWEKPVKSKPVPAVPRIPIADDFPPNARMVKIKDGNPKKPGTNRHIRWEVLMKFVAKGAAVAEYLAVKGSRASSIKDALELGYIKLEGE
jgi:hypothetical protein